MKKTLLFLMMLLVLLSSLGNAAFSESDTWACPSCGTVSSGNFCSICGAKKPETANKADEIASDSFLSESIPITIHIDFDENAMFSTYDVEMYVDEKLIVKMAHGKNYDGTMDLSPGDHIVQFFKAGSTKVTGSCSFEITEPSAFSCNIHANSDKVTVRKVKVTVSEGPTIIYVNGQTELELTIDFRRNAAFSTYDVDLYCDDVFISTLPHGEGFHGILNVSEGIHTITFFEHGNKEKSGNSEFSVNGNTVFSCHIEATKNGIVVTEEKLNNHIMSIEKTVESSPKPTEKPKLLIYASKVGTYGKTRIMDKGTEFERIMYQQFVPTGKYIATNVGGTGAVQVSVYKNEISITPEGWEEYTPGKCNPIVLMQGESGEIIVYENEFIKLSDGDNIVELSPVL
ncbi:MAG: hypothetical protein IKP32_07515 [Clostridia bacterium]|nr:hypothetical protein [Clostridia bacterium]